MTLFLSIDMSEKASTSTLIVGKASQFADISNYLARGALPEFKCRAKKKAFFGKVGNFFWDDSYLFHVCANNVIFRCITEEEVPKVLAHFYSYTCGEYRGIVNTAAKINTSGFYWLTPHKDIDQFLKSCGRSQKVGNISMMNEMPQKYIPSVNFLIVGVLTSWVPLYRPMATNTF